MCNRRRGWSNRKGGRKGGPQQGVMKKGGVEGMKGRVCWVRGKKGGDGESKMSVWNEGGVGERKGDRGKEGGVSRGKGTKSSGK